jgi:tight adherence protein B
MLSELVIICFIVFCAAILAVQGAYWFFVENRKSREAVNRRLLLSTQDTNAQDVLDSLKRERGFDGFEHQYLSRFNDLLTQTGLRLSSKILVAAAFALSVAYFSFLGLIIGFGLPIFFSAPPLAAISLLLFFARVRNQRIARFSEQLPDALDIIVRGVKSGYPFTVALELVAKEMSDPIGTEFGMTSDEINFGLGLNAAFDNLYRRVGQGDLLFFSMAAKIQVENGGSLAEILSRLARLLRQREKLRLKVRTMTAEGRLSAVFLSAMPFLLIGVVSLVSPGYYSDVVTNPLIVPAAGGGLFLLLLGNIAIFRMVHFKV